LRDHSVGLLRNYRNQGPRTVELTEILETAQDSERVEDDRALPQSNALHLSMVKRIIEDYEAGASTYSLATRYNMRRNTVRDTLRRAGFDLRGNAKKPALTAEEKSEIRLRFENGASRRELTSLFGVSESTIKRALRV